MIMRWRAYLLDFLSVIIYGSILLLKTYFVKFSLVGAEPLHRSFWMGTLGATLVLTALLWFFKQRMRLYVFFGINLFVSLLLIADIVYARYFSDVISMAVLKQAKLATGVQDSVLALIRPRDLAYLLDLFILMPALWLIKRKSAQRVGLDWISRVTLFCVCLLLGTNLVQASTASLQQRQPGLIRALWDKQVVANNIGALNYHAMDLWRYAKKQATTTRLPDEEQQYITSWFAEQGAKATHKYSKTMQGKNLIMVQLEAFQGFVLNLEMNGQEVTPNLNRLSKQSLTFNNAYYQTAMGGTSDAEFLANVSLFPARDGTAYYEYASNSLQSLALAAKKKGYSTAVMHPFRPGFWNRPTMYATLGFDAYLNQEHFEQDERFGMGLADHSFYRQAVAEMRQLQQPFYTFLISLSSHFPFTDPSVDLTDRLKLGEFSGTQLGNFLLNAHYADEAIGLLIEELKTANLWDNSIVVFYGDHAAVPPANNQQLAQLLADGNELNAVEWQQAQKVVMMMHLPQDKLQGDINLAVGQIDVFPTVANLLGFDACYALGQDLLNTNSNFVCFRNGNWINEEVVYLRAADEIRSLRTGGVLPKADFEETIRLAAEKLRISDLTLEHDLIRMQETGTGE